MLGEEVILKKPTYLFMLLRHFQIISGSLRCDSQKTSWSNEGADL